MIRSFSLLRWAAIWLAIVVSCTSYAQGLAVTVTGLTTDVSALYVNTSLDGKSGSSIADITGNLSQFGLDLPAGATGSLAVSIAARRADGCITANGQGQVMLTGQQGMRYNLTVPLTPASTATCSADMAAADMKIAVVEVLISAGQFLMGSATGDGGDSGARSDEFPLTTESVSAFYLDQTEVTVSAYTACVMGKGCTPPAMPGGKCDNYGVAEKGNHPINCVDWNQANTYCQWRGARLPTEIEWEYAARGSAHSTYSWGNDAPVAPGADGGMPQACWDLIMGTCPVGQYPRTLFGQLNPNGLSDMAGGVWEWVDGYYCPYPLPNQTCSNTDRVRRGGSWGDLSPAGLRAAYRLNLSANIYDPSIGFRCARTP